MGRWQPGAAGRLEEAALQLYAERGYEQTTVADIAERAGVTERTYFRYFADKREVLFAGSAELERAVVEAIAAAPDGTALRLAEAGVLAAAGVLGRRREHALVRAGVVASATSLQERELLKMVALSTAVATALRDRGIPAEAAAVAGETAIGMFRLSFEAWVADPDPDADYAAIARAHFARLASLVG